MSIKQPFLTQRLSVAQVAAADLIDSVGAMREAVWASAKTRPNPDSIETLAYDLDRTCRAHQRSLPKGLHSLRHELRAATGNYLGGASGYALDPELSAVPLSDHEQYWWDIATTYLDYVIDTLGMWRSNPNIRGFELIPFHEWRRDEDDAYHAQRRDGSGPTPESCTCDAQWQ